jgi:hypothetical protein
MDGRHQDMAGPVGASPSPALPPRQNNNQVAAGMYINTHIVVHHVRKAFRKLTITSRIEQAVDGVSQRN